MRNLIIVCICLLLLACTSAQKKEETFKKAEINLQLGVRYLEQGRVDDALEKIKKALRFEPDYPEAHSSIAEVYRRIEEPEKSREHYERALELLPDSGRIHNNYAILLCGMGEYQEAEPHFLSAINSRGYRTQAEALENLGVCMMRIPDLEKAEKYLRQALRINPRLPRALLKMARIGLEKGRYMSGRAYLQRFQEVVAMNPESLWLGIQVERKLGDKKAAQEYETQLRRTFPDSEETKLLLETESRKK